MMAAPPRGFEKAEFEHRCGRAQAIMRDLEVDALLLTTEPDVRYVTGFFSQFWKSPTRPWFTVLPLEGLPIAVIPEIGAAGMAATWVEDIRTWPAPRPEDDGIGLLAAALKGCKGRFGRIGVPLGHESHLRMPAGDFQRLLGMLGGAEILDAAPLIHHLRGIKSAAEIAKIHYVCQVTSAAFEALPGSLRAGDSEHANCQRFRSDLIARGADHSPYMVAASGPGGYDNIIMGPTDKIIDPGDILIIDTGTVYDGYYCDFDRNFAFGPPGDAVRRAHHVVTKATDAGIAVARPGATTSDLWKAMADVLDAGGSLGNNVGRLGHGLGMQLTEGPSNTPGDGTVLVPGMVMTIEPGMTFAPGKLMVHEENIVITEDGNQLLTRRAPPEMPIIV